MKKILLAIVLLFSFLAWGQTDINRPTRTDLLRQDPHTTTEMNAISGAREGDQVYNSTTKTVWNHNGTTWVDTGSGGGSGDVTAASAFANDNRIIRSDGTGKGVQNSGVVINDNDAIIMAGELDMNGNAITAVSDLQVNGTSALSITSTGGFFTAEAGARITSGANTKLELQYYPIAQPGGVLGEIYVDKETGKLYWDADAGNSSPVELGTSSSAGIVAEGVQTTAGTQNDHVVTHNLGYAPANTRIQVQSLNQSSGFSMHVKDITTTTFTITNSTTSNGIDMAWRIFGTGAITGQQAGEVSYDNATSGLTGANVQAAIDELATSGGGAGLVTVSNMTALIALSPSDGDIVYVEGYTTQNDGGGGFFRYDASQARNEENGGTIIGPTAIATQVANFANNTVSPASGNGSWIRQLDNHLPVDPRWFGIQYAGVGVDEWNPLQAAVNYSHELAFANGIDGAGIVTVGGNIRVSKTVTNLSRTILQGVGQKASGIYHNSGNTATSGSNYVLDFGNATWGGYEDIRIQGYDQFNGQDEDDAPDYLIRYSFVDLEHVSKDSFLKGWQTACILIETEITNLVLENLFFDGSRGYLVDIQGTVGGNRMLSMNDFTHVTGLADQDFKGMVRTKTPINFSVNGANIEWNNNTTATDFALFYADYVGTVTKSHVTLSGMTAHVTGINYAWPIISARTVDQVSLNITNSKFRDALTYHYRTPDEYGNVIQEGGDVVGAGLSNTSIEIGTQKIMEYSSDSKPSTSFNNRVKNKDIAFTNNDESTGIVYKVPTGQSMTPASNSWQNVAKFPSASVNDVVLSTIEYWYGLTPGLAIRIPDAGAGGVPLVTTIVSIDNINQTITIADPVLTAFATDKVATTVSADSDYFFLGSVDTVPVQDLGLTSKGTHVFARDINSFVQWDGDEWIPGMAVFSGTTAERPNYYDNNPFHVGRLMYDTTIGDLIIWNGTAWEVVSGGAADGNDFVTAGSISGTNMVLTIPNQSDVSIDLSQLLPTEADTTITYGSNIIINGTFDADTDWAKTNATISGGTGNISVVAGSNSLIQQLSVPFVDGTTYRLTVDVTRTSGTGGMIYFADTSTANGGLNIGDTNTSLTGTLQQLTFTWTANGNSNMMHIARGVNSGDYTIAVDNVVVQEETEVITEGRPGIIYGGEDYSSLDIVAFGNSVTSQALNWTTTLDSILKPEKLTNMAVSGQKITWDPSTVETTTTGVDNNVNNRFWNSIKYWESIKTTDPDLIIIQHGTNDTAQPLGDYADAFAQSEASTTHLTMAGAFRKALHYLITNYPDCQIMYSTPLQSKTNGRDYEILNQIGNINMDIANRYGVPVFKTTIESGILDEFEPAGAAGRYLTDGVHPNAAGAELHGKYMALQVKNNYKKY